MKNMLKTYSLILLLILSYSSRAQSKNEEPAFEKTKSLTKSYPFTGSDMLKIDNRFGDVKVNLWDKAEVKVEIQMSGKANTEELAQDLIDRITIEEGKSGSTVNFKTKIVDKKTPVTKGQKYVHTRFSINYTIFMPSQNALYIENEFGKVSVPDYKGEITIKQKFGQLTAGRLSNVKKILVEFSNGTVIESVNGGDLEFKFSRSQVNRMEGVVNVSVEHSGGVKLMADNSLKKLNITNAFTQLYLDVPTNLSANYKVHTNFSELNNKSSFGIKEEIEEDRRGPKFDHDYNGQSGNGNIPVKINSEFGEVTIGHNMQFDVNAKEEKKAKARTRAV